MSLINDGNRKWWVLAAMGSVLGMCVLDETVVGVALPSMRDDLGMSQVTAHWVVNAYLLVFTGFVVTGGRLGDLYGHERIFFAGAAVFALASVACGFAPSSGWLIAARVVQALGSAVIFPSSMAMISVVFPPAERSRALGLYVTIAGVFVALGPLVGGIFTELLSWRWIFWINPPIALVVVLMVKAAWVHKPHTAAEKRERLDIIGLALLVAGLSALVLGLMQGDSWGWLAPHTLACMAGGVLLLAAFAFYERRPADPLIDFALLRRPTVTSANLIVFAAQFGKIGTIVFGALFVQDVLHRSALVSGLVLMIAIAPAVATSNLFGRLTERLGTRRTALGGLLLHALALLGLALVSPLQSFGWFLVPLIAWGATLPDLFIPTRRAAVFAVPETQHGQASGISVTAQMLGGTIGVAICGTLLTVTGNFFLVFLAPAIMAFVALAIGWRFLEWDERKT